MNVTRPLITALLLALPFSQGAIAGVLPHSVNALVGLSPASAATITVSDSGPAGSLMVSHAPTGMFNNLSWGIDSDSVFVESDMSGGPGASDIAYLESSWNFEITGHTMEYVLFASVGQINSRLQDLTTGLHLLPGDGNWIFAGSYTGSLLAGHSYSLQLQTSVAGDSSFSFEVPEPGTGLLLLLGLMLALYSNGTKRLIDPTRERLSARRHPVRRKARSLPIFAVFAAALLATLPAKAAILWGLQGNQGGGGGVDNSLFTYDTNSGVFDTVGMLPDFSFGGLAFDGDDLYARLATDLYLVDQSDASTTFLGSAPGDYESFAIVDGVGYATDAFTNILYSVNLTDGSLTAIGSHGGTSDLRISGMTAVDGELYGVRGAGGGTRDLVRLDKSTGAIGLVVGNHGLEGLTNLAFAEGSFWSVDAADPSFGLYMLDTATGAATGAGALGIHVTGLTSSVPVPGTLALLFSGLAGLFAYRARKTRR